MPSENQSSGRRRRLWVSSFDESPYATRATFRVHAAVQSFVVAALSGGAAVGVGVLARYHGVFDYLLIDAPGPVSIPPEVREAAVEHSLITVLHLEAIAQADAVVGAFIVAPILQLLAVGCIVVFALLALVFLVCGVGEVIAALDGPSHPRVNDAE